MSFEIVVSLLSKEADLIIILFQWRQRRSNQKLTVCSNQKFTHPDVRCSCRDGQGIVLTELLQHFYWFKVKASCHSLTVQKQSEFNFSTNSVSVIPQNNCTPNFLQAQKYLYFKM